MGNALEIENRMPLEEKNQNSQNYTIFCQIIHKILIELMNNNQSTKC